MMASLRSRQRRAPLGITHESMLIDDHAPSDGFPPCH